VARLEERASQASSGSSPTPINPKPTLCTFECARSAHTVPLLLAASRVEPIAVGATSPGLEAESVVKTPTDARPAEFCFDWDATSGKAEPTCREFGCGHADGDGNAAVPHTDGQLSVSHTEQTAPHVHTGTTTHGVMTGPNRAVVAVLDPVTLQEPCREGWAQQSEQAQPPAHINATATSGEVSGTADPAQTAVDDAESVDSLTEWLEPLDLKQWSPSRNPHSTLSHWKLRKLKVPSHLAFAHRKRAPKEGESWPLLAELQKVAVSPLPTLRFELMLNGKLCVCLLDSGASISAARDGFVRKFEWPTAPARTPSGQSIQVTAYDGSTRDNNIALKSARIKIDGFRGELPLLVLPLSGEDVILGMDFLTAYKAQIDIASRTDRLTDAKGRFHLIQAPAELNCSDPSIQARLCKAAAKDIEQGATAYLTVVKASDDTNGTATAGPGHSKTRSPKCVGDVSDLKAKYSSIFQPITGLPPKRHVDHPIDLAPGAGTPCGPVYRLAPAEIDELRKQLDELLTKGLIEPSSSPFGVT